MRLVPLAAASLLTLSLGGCANRAPATRSAIHPSPTVIVEDGVIVNELDVLQGTDQATLSRELDAMGGVLVSQDPRLRTELVWFPTHSRSELRKVKDALAAKGISANLVITLPPVQHRTSRRTR